MDDAGPELIQEEFDMRRLLLLLGVMVLGLAVACGGGDDSDGGSSDGGADSKFCSPDESDAVFDQLDFSGASMSEIDYGAVKDALKDWEKSAPSEVRDDVKVMAEGIRGLLELLEENDGNFMALAMTAESDPRMLALDSDEFLAASDRLDEYCGFEIGGFGDTGSADSGTSGGSTGDSSSAGASTGGNGTSTAGGGFSGAMGLPDDFPTTLVPPKSELTFAGSLAGALTGEWTSTMTIEEVLAYYSDEYGDPMYADSESALWSIVDDDELIAVNVEGTDGDLTISVVIVTQ